MLQQHLPFTVLKLIDNSISEGTVPIRLQQHLPFTVLKPLVITVRTLKFNVVATAPTVYGIETVAMMATATVAMTMLQQHLPFTVLKHRTVDAYGNESSPLQQHLPFTVLKQTYNTNELDHQRFF